MQLHVTHYSSEIFVDGEVERGKRKKYGQQQKYAVREIFSVFVLNVPVNTYINSQVYISQGEFVI